MLPFLFSFKFSDTLILFKMQCNMVAWRDSVHNFHTEHPQKNNFLQCDWLTDLTRSLG